MRARDPFDTLSRVQAALGFAARDAQAERREYLHALMGEVYELGRHFAAPSRIVLAPADAPGWWLVGPEGSEQRLHYPHLGLRAAHLALTGSSPLCADLAPGSANADRIVRRAVRKTALDWAERVARCAELATALRGMSVHGTPARLEYRAAANAPMFLLCSSPFTPNR